MEYRLGELYCGAGGLAYGAKTAEVANGDKIIHAWANDIDHNACNSYRRNICPENPDSVFCADIRNFDTSVLPAIDALAFGFPCNDFSLVGEHKGFNGTYGPLYTYGIKVLSSHKPLWFVAENVSGLTSANNGVAWKTIKKDMENAGYNLTPHLYKFEEYGIPQSRHRVIIVGIRKDLNRIFQVPSTKNFKMKTCREAIEVPPISSRCPNNEKSIQSGIVIERLKYIKPGENAFTADIPDYLKLNVKRAKISQIYKRLDPDKPAYTITGSGGGGTHVYHWSENRALTNRERARLQTFPDSFVFMGSKESVRKQIGMAVPVEGAKIIFESILKTMSGVQYDSVPANIKEQM